MLKVTISEMRRDIAKQLGITSSSWGALTQYNPFAINGALSANTSGTFFPGTAAALPTTSGLNLNSGSGLLATLQAFERYGVTRTLAEPTVTAVSGEGGSLHRRRRISLLDRVGLLRHRDGNRQLCRVLELDL